MTGYDVAVFGSCMIDLVCCAPRLPKVGETLHGSNFFVGHGGKGANQCVAAAKLGASCALIARLGNDSFGNDYAKYLADNKINIENVTLTDGVSSGMAQITVADNGDNHIVIVAGANNYLCSDDIMKAGNVLMNSKVVAFQFEVPLAITIEALKFIQQIPDGNEKPFTIINGAPALAELDHQIFTLCDCFCVNESEAVAVTGINVSNLDGACDAAKKLLEFGCKMVIITLGGEGVVFATAGTPIEYVSVENVIPVDTTGAGDAFVGAFAYFTAKFDLPLHERIHRACAIATVSVMSRGTQTSFPTKDSLPKDLFLPLKI